MNNRAEVLEMAKFNIEHTTGTKVPVYKNSPNEWIINWFTLNQVKFNYDGNHSIYDVVEKCFKEINQSRLLNFIIVGTGLIDAPKVRSLIQPFVENWEFKERKRVRLELIENVSFKVDQKNNGLLQKFVRALTGEEDEVDIAVIYNFITSVKKKMNGMQPDIDLFSILQGKQNSGKSTAVRRLLEPINRFWTDRSLDMLNQEKNLKVLSQKYVIWFDEMARAKRTDVDAVKKYTTGTHINFREFYTQNEVSYRNISTFIGCTNRSVVDIFYDPTGSRRFYELKCIDKIDHDAINSIDYLKLWQSVNESGPTTLLNFQNELDERQQSLRSMDSIEEFLSQEDLIPTDQDEVMEVKFSDLYLAYSKWLSSQKMGGQFKKKSFASRLNDLGIKEHRKSNARCRWIKKTDDFYSLLPSS